MSSINYGRVERVQAKLSKTTASRNPSATTLLKNLLFWINQSQLRYLRTKNIQKYFWSCRHQIYQNISVKVRSSQSNPQKNCSKQNNMKEHPQANELTHCINPEDQKSMLKDQPCIKKRQNYYSERLITYKRYQMAKAPISRVVDREK